MDVLKPVLYIGLTLGLVPYSIHKQHLFVPACLYSLVVMFLVWQSCVDVLSMVDADSGYLLPLQITLNSLISLISLSAVLYRYQMWLDIFKGLQHVDNITKALKCNTGYSNSVVIQTVGIAFLPVITVVYYFSFYYKTQDINWFIVCGQSLATALNILLLVEFLTYVTILQSNFTSLNKVLIHHQNRQLEDVRMLFGSVREAHRIIYSLSKQVNNAFGYQLLASVSKTIILITTILYNVSLLFIKSSDDSSLVYLLVMAVTLVHNTAELLVLVIVCSSVGSQADYTSVVVHKLMNEDLPKDSIEELQLFSYQLLHQKVYFSVCGFFNLDFTLLNGVIASVATYLVILIQFQM